MTPAAPSPALRITEARDRRAMIRFLEMPRALYADDPNWVAPLLFERLNHLDPRKNPFFSHAEAAFWVALKDGRAVGRISAQVNQAHLDRHGDHTGHFGFLEAEDDAEIFALLLGTAEAWLRERGLARVIGPYSLSINDESGLLVEGFGTPPSLMMGHARPYYDSQMAARGYVKEKDLIAYDYDLTAEPPETLKAFIRKAQAENDLVFRPINMARYDQELALIVDIFNDAWAGNWGFLPFGEPEMRYLAKNLKPLVKPECVAIAEISGEAAAMAISLPNINAAIADLGGRLLPFGWAKLLWRVKVRGVDSARLPLMGVRRRFQGTPLSTALMLGVIETIRAYHRRHGTRRGELSWILEDNRPVRKLIEMFGGRPYKTYRLYAKDLT
jgi:GNAT superfamily N-acetyltransferase